MTQSMLEGFKVVDFTHVIAGPHCTKMLAEYGAEVIKIEPPGGERARLFPAHRKGRSGFFIQHNVGKKSMGLDIATPEGQTICRELIKEADVVVENFTPGVMKRNNLDWDSLRKINPDLVMCSITCFGQTGPLSSLPGYDWIAQSYAGIIDLLGEPDGSPIFGDFAFGDVSTSAHAYGAIMSALLHRLRGGKGQHIDISLVEVLFSYHELNVQLYDTTGDPMVARRSGARHGTVGPAVGVYKCKDRYLFIVGVQNHWKDLLTAMGREELMTDSRFASLDAMGVEHQDKIDTVIADWLDSLDDVSEALAVLQEHRVPCAPILSIPEVMEHPCFVERGMIRTVTDSIFGDVRIPRTPLRFSEFPDTPDLRAPNLGQHNHEILRECLYYTDQQIADLEARNIIGSKNI